MVVYWVRNTVNDKIYIGQTKTSLKKRWYMHCWDGSGNSLLHKAIVKHGKENFSIESIHACETKEEMNFVETFYIIFLRSRAPYGYNLTDGGEGSLGVPRSEETKKKIGLGNSNHSSWAKGVKGKDHPLFGIAPTSAFPKGNTPWNKGVKGAQVSWMRGKTVPEVTREKIRRTLESLPKKTHCKRGHPRTPENVTATGKCKACQKLSNDAR